VIILFGLESFGDEVGVFVSGVIITKSRP